MTQDSPSSYASPFAWRHIGNSPYHVEHGHSPAFVDGALHWVISRSRHPELMDDIEQTILAINVETEEFSLIPRPIECLDLSITRRGDLRLVELRGLLCLSFVAGDKFDIWMLRDYQSQNHIFKWVKEYSFDLSTIDNPYRHSHRFYALRDIQDDGNKFLIDLIMMWHTGSFMFYYHPQTANFRGPICKNISFFSFYTESLRSLRHVLQKGFKFDQIIEGTLSQSQVPLLELESPIYVVRVFAFVHPIDQHAYGGYITDVKGKFVAVEGKKVDVGDRIETEAKAILCGLEFGRRQGIQHIGLVSNAKELVDAIITGETQSFHGLDKILNMITHLLSEFSWAQIFHDRRFSTQVGCQLATHASWYTNFCCNEPPKWFKDG
ncbi:hypothetical protein NE237_007091 [Protea cynaroides]|uniref:RNase H type-1 domain-containing protein n=1 Tax=Protea cynaroides TaxID=273540 RepID=A0A9Q0QW27_9MAGN|nr:hypothetical protein NE237_007091 [Protea cynaroides]